MRTSRMASEARSGYLPSLDGWRALAIAGVMLNHDLPWTLGAHSSASWTEYGAWGVYLFFAISGILICGRMLEDEATTGVVNLRSFYLRRLFRIQPAQICYLAVIAVLTAVGVSHESWRSIRGALLAYLNFLYRASDTSGGTAFVGHFWTLAVEEHFYLVLSLFLFFCRRNRVVLFSVGLGAMCMAQAAALRMGAYSWDVSARRTQWILQFLLFPALVAMLLRRRRVRGFADRWLRPWLVFGGSVLLALLIRRRGSTLSGGHEPILFCLTFWVVATMLHPRSLTTRVLEWGPLRFIGRLSYSLYLWHVLFFVPVFPVVGIRSPGLLLLSERPWKYLATAATALLSYFLVEKPLIRLGHRLAPPATPGHRDLDSEAVAATEGLPAAT